MSGEEVHDKSLSISEKLIASIDWAGVKNMHLYSDVPEWNEVQTEPILEHVRQEWPGIKITLPDSSVSQEPPKQQFDLIIVPCLGFDKNLHRLGLGAGFYDRFLAQQPRALKIGLSFADGSVKSGLPREPHDIVLDKIITEEGIMEAHDS